MHSGCKRIGGSITPLLGLLAWVSMATPVFAVGATRDLPEYYTPDETFTVAIAVDTPEDTGVQAIEDSPPAGWTQIDNISHYGTYDSIHHKVKWGPFFDDDSRTVTYDITPPSGASGEECFDGSVSFDGINEPIEGDECVLPLPQCQITVTSPAGGQPIARGSSFNIVWNSSDTSGNVTIDVLKGGGLCETLAANTPDDGGFTWNPVDPPCTDGSDYQIKISDVVDPTCAGASAEFTIVVEPVPTVSAWGVVAMALLMLTAGTLVLRRCRPACD